MKKEKMNEGRVKRKYIKQGEHDGLVGAALNAIINDDINTKKNDIT